MFSYRKVIVMGRYVTFYFYMFMSPTDLKILVSEFLFVIFSVFVGFHQKPKKNLSLWEQNIDYRRKK